MQKLQQETADDAPVEPAPIEIDLPTEIDLLTEIRDELRKEAA